MIKSKRQQQKEETKKLIVTVAYRVYSEKGFKATTSDIAKEAKLSHGTIFAHFATLKDLLIYILDDFGENIGKRLHEFTEDSESIKDVLEAHLNVLEKYENFYTKIITETNLLPEEARNIFVRTQSILSFHFKKVLDKEIIKGNIKELPIHFIFNSWIGIVHYYLQNRDLFSPHSSVINRYRSELINSFIKLIKI